MKRILNTQGKHELLIVFLIAAPLMIAGVVWAIIEGGYSEPRTPVTPVSTPATDQSTPAAFIIVDDA